VSADIKKARACAIRFTVLLVLLVAASVAFAWAVVETSGSTLVARLAGAVALVVVLFRADERLLRWQRGQRTQEDA
jgi:hypothetical protein